MELTPEFNNNQQFSLMPKPFPGPGQSTQIKQEPVDYSLTTPGTSYMLKNDEMEKMPPPPLPLVQNYASVVRTGINLNKNNKSNPRNINPAQMNERKKHHEDVEETYSLLQEIIKEDLCKDEKN